MMQYLSSYILTDHELTKVCDDIRAMTERCLAGKDRLHNFVQLYEVAKTIIEQLEIFDKEGFLIQIQDDLKNIRADLDKELSERATTLQERYTSIQNEAQMMENELQKRGECIESVLSAMQKTEDCRPAVDEIRQKMEALERNIKELQAIRQSAPFIEMCKLVTYES